VPLSEDLNGHFPTSVTTVHGEWPQYVDGRDVTYRVPCYGGSVLLVTPILSIAARLLFVAVRELTPMSVPPQLYVNRQHAAQHGHGEEIMPTQADIHEVNAMSHAKLRPRPNWDWLAGLSPAERHHEISGLSRGPFRAPSFSWDDEFIRLMYCNDGYHIHPDKGCVYTPGSITGRWAGRFNVSILRLDLRNPDLMKFCRFLPRMATRP
jgi:hypothetical protein